MTDPKVEAKFKHRRDFFNPFANKGRVPEEEAAAAPNVQLQGQPTSSSSSTGSSIQLDIILARAIRNDAAMGKRESWCRSVTERWQPNHDCRSISK